MSKTIVLATRNANKTRELAGRLASAGVRVIDLSHFPEMGETEETGASFDENALVKARAAAKFTGLPAVADDSGLCVDALGGGPGIFSARFADDWECLPGETRDQRNTRKLLHELRGKKNRKARYHASIAGALPDGSETVVQGEWEGEILLEPRGSNGFGYDPVFFDPLAGKTAAEMSAEEKTSRSHRGKALNALLGILPEFLKD